MNVPIAIETMDTASARLPVSYEAARTALANCASIDECQTWANKAQALASYARQADDDTLQKLAIRIQSHAVRRCGELLKEIDGRGRPVEENKEVARPVYSQAQAARDAGMSPHQCKQAVRVANVPAARFEAAVESDQPPTVTALADMGRQARAADPPPGFSAAIQFGGHVRRLAEFAAEHGAAFVGNAVADFNRREMRAHIARCRRLFDEIAPFIREDRNGI